MALDTKKLQTSGVYEARAPFAALLQDIEQIGNMVQAAETKRHNLRKYAGGAMILGLVSAIIAGAINSNAFGFSAFLAFTVGVGMFIYSFISGRELHKHHDRYELLRDLSKTLQVDADPKAKFAVKLAIKADPTLLREELVPQKKNGKQKFFEEDFLTMAGELLDGTYLEQTVTENTRSRTHTNPRGKTKTKTRARYLLSVRLVYPGDLYGDARAAQQMLQEQLRLPDSATLKSLGVSEKAISIKTMVGLEQDVPKASAMACLGAYRILNLARRNAGGAKGDGQ